MVVLVVDDSQSVRRIIALGLRQLGASEVVEAESGEKALQILRFFNNVDLIMTDWNMPGKNGIELIHEIRALDPKIPIVMITTEADKARVLEAIQAGVSDYLIKPFTTDLLRSKLEPAGIRIRTIRGLGYLVEPWKSEKP